jgi:hypothetical protein
MTWFSVGAEERQEQRQSSFEELVSLIKGRSIISAADWGDERFELGLSGGVMMRFFRGRDGMEINLISTTNPDDIPPLFLSLGDMPARVPISVIERKLSGLRTLYAIYYLAHLERLPELTSYLIRHPRGDIERALLTEEELLYIESISYGSWVLAVWAKSKRAYQALSSVAGLVFERGREAYLAKLEAEARLAQARARREEISAATAEFDLKRRQLEYLRKVSDQISIPEVRQNLERIMVGAARNLTTGDAGDSESYLRLTQALDK